MTPRSRRSSDRSANRFVSRPMLHGHGRTVAHVDLDQIVKNFRALVAHAAAAAKSPNMGAIAMVKANAYGHGIVPVGVALERCFKAGTSTPVSLPYQALGVATLDEALTLRAGGITAPIVVFTDAVPLGDDCEDILERHHLTPVIHTAEDLRRTLRGRRTYPFHLKINTGLNRLGLDLDEFAAIEDELRTHSKGRFQGVCTHFAASDEPTSELTKRQVGRFQAVLSLLGDGVPPCVHMANTGAIVHGKALGIDQMCNVIRPGLGLYGYGASANVAVKPVLTWWVQVLKTRKLDAGERVGYSGTFTAKSTMAAAVLGVGYGDGFLRAHSNGQLWNGKLSPRRILGRVSMDLTIIEGRGLKVGDWVSLVGENPAQAEKLATQGQTIVYEVLTALSPRVPRVYSTLENERS